MRTDPDITCIIMCYTEDSLRGAADTNFGYVYVPRVYLAYHFFKKNYIWKSILEISNNYPLPAKNRV